MRLIRNVALLVALSATLSGFGFTQGLMHDNYSVTENPHAFGNLGSHNMFFGNLSSKNGWTLGVYNGSFNFSLPVSGKYTVKFEIEYMSGKNYSWQMLIYDTATGFDPMATVDSGTSSRLSLVANRQYRITFASGISQYQSATFFYYYRVTIEGDQYVEAPNRAMITYNGNGGTFLKDNFSKPVGAWIVYLPDVVRDNYTLLGWYTPTGTKVTAYSQYPMPAGGLALTARWKAGDDPNYFKQITFHGNGGTVRSPQSLSIEYVSDIQVSVRRANPEYWPYGYRAGYDLVGWYTKASGGTAALDLENFYGITDLYAHWTQKQYEVKVAPGKYSTGKEQAYSKTYGEKVQLPGAIYTRDGYVMTGWSTSEYGSYYNYALNGYYTANESDTLYPYWTASENAPTVNPQQMEFGHTNGIGKLSVSCKGTWYINCGDCDWLKLSANSGNGNGEVSYTFTANEGWKDRTAVISVTSIGGSVVFEQTAEIVQTPEMIDVCWDYNYNGRKELMTVPLRAPISEIKPQISRAGYTMLGWSRASMLDRFVEDSDSFCSSYSSFWLDKKYQPVMIYARWHKDDYPEEVEYFDFRHTDSDNSNNDFYYSESGIVVAGLYVDITEYRQMASLTLNYKAGLTRFYLTSSGTLSSPLRMSIRDGSYKELAAIENHGIIEVDLTGIYCGHIVFSGGLSGGDGTEFCVQIGGARPVIAYQGRSWPYYIVYGSDGVDSIEYEYDPNTVYKLPRGLFSNGSQKFLGWSADNGRRYDDGMLFHDLAPQGGRVKMSAIWETESPWYYNPEEKTK